MVALIDLDKDLVTMIHKQQVRKLHILIALRALHKHTPESDEHLMVNILTMLCGNQLCILSSLYTLL